MSTTSAHAAAVPDEDLPWRGAPKLGALLRLSYEAARIRAVAALYERGFGDITQTELGLFHFPGPDGARPIDLAQRCHMSKQAMNYVLTHMEASGYLERRGAEGENRLVFLTRRGHRVYKLLRETMFALEAELRQKIGARRFDAFLDVLQEIVLEEQREHAESNSAGRTHDLPRRRPRG
jgi:DNA-binding MarR family transcriptional regulator